MIVTFPLSVEVQGPLVLESAHGDTLPLQRYVEGRATFILPSLAAGESKVFKIQRAATPEVNGPRVTNRGKAVELASNARAVVHFQMQGELPAGIEQVYLRGGYLHPLFTPSGVRLTDDYPDSHRHQHGIWSAWTRARFNDHGIDFWNMAEQQGKVDFRALEETWTGPVFAGFRARLAHVDLLGSEPVDVLDERWSVRTYQTHRTTPPYFVVDLDSSQQVVTEAPLLLEEYLYGGFALRGHAQWADPANVKFSTSEGLDRARGDNTKGRWCYIGGRIDGDVVGFAMLGHPHNFRAPQTFRIHPQDPYMAFAPIKDGPFTIEPGRPYVSRFRILSFDGPFDQALVERLWRDYATPPKVEVTVE